MCCKSTYKRYTKNVHFSRVMKTALLLYLFERLDYPEQRDACPVAYVRALVRTYALTLAHSHTQRGIYAGKILIYSIAISLHTPITFSPRNNLLVPSCCRAATTAAI